MTKGKQVSYYGTGHFRAVSRIARKLKKIIFNMCCFKY